MSDTQTQASKIQDELRVRGGQVLDKANELIAKGNARSLIVKHDGKVVVEFPLTVGVIGSVLAPQLAALGAIAALVTGSTIEIVGPTE